MLYGPSTDDISPEWLRGIDLPASPSQRLAGVIDDVGRQRKHACTGLLFNAIAQSRHQRAAQLWRHSRTAFTQRQAATCNDRRPGMSTQKGHCAVSQIRRLEPLKVPEIEGVRLYGRRAGQKQPIWSHSRDYTYRARMVPEAKPEFAASDSYAGELITPVSDRKPERTQTKPITILVLEPGWCKPCGMR